MGFRGLLSIGVPRLSLLYLQILIRGKWLIRLLRRLPRGWSKLEIPWLELCLSVVLVGLFGSLNINNDRFWFSILIFSLVKGVLGIELFEQPVF